MIKLLKFVFYISVLLLIIISLYPGSLIGLLLYGDLSLQPNLVKNPFGTTINHFLAYFYISNPYQVSVQKIHYTNLDKFFDQNHIYINFH